MCLSDLPRISMCDSDRPKRYKVRSAYVISPRYPDVYPENTDCSCLMKTEGEARLQLEVSYHRLVI